MGHALSIDAVINIIFGIAMTAIGVITIAQTAHLARLYSRSTGMLSISN
jgi:putative exporter of polyketide antibiotics